MRAGPVPSRGSVVRGDGGALAIRVQPDGATVLVDGERWDALDGRGELLDQARAGGRDVRVLRRGHPLRVVAVAAGEAEAADALVAAAPAGEGDHLQEAATGRLEARLLEGDAGPNTGGMGAYSPVSLATPELLERTRADEGVSTRDQFMGMVSHDLRTLLGGIALQAVLLKRGGGEDEAGRRAVQAAEKIQRYTARMSRLIGDLVDVASIEEGRIRVAPEPQDLAVLAGRGGDPVAPTVPDGKVGRVAAVVIVHHPVAVGEGRCGEVVVMRLGHDESGSGDPLVLLHGVGTSRAVWRRALPSSTPRD